MVRDTLLGFPSHTLPYRCGKHTTLSAPSSYHPGGGHGNKSADFSAKKCGIIAGSTFKRPAGAFAAALIDQCGLRGYRHGGAAVSDKHCGFVVNLGGATCADVLALCDEVRAIVKEKTGYDLEKEIRVVK